MNLFEQIRQSNANRQALAVDKAIPIVENENKSAKENPDSLQAIGSKVVSPCPGCGGISQWLPRFEIDAWRCIKCFPPLHAALISETRENIVFDDCMVVFDVMTVCIEKQICHCGSRWLDFTMAGYRCGVCGSFLNQSADELFWISDVRNDKKRRSFR